MEEAKSADQIDGGKRGSQKRINCIFCGRSLCSPTDLQATSQVTKAAGPKIYALVYFDWTLCNCPRPLHSIRRCRSWSSTLSCHAHSSSYSSSIFSTHITKDWCKNSDSFSPWTSLCIADCSYCRNSSIDTASFIWNLWCDVVPNDGSIGCSGNVLSTISWRRGSPEDCAASSIACTQSSPRCWDGVWDYAPWGCTPHLARGSDASTVHGNPNQCDCSEVAAF